MVAIHLVAHFGELHICKQPLYDIIIQCHSEKTLLHFYILSLSAASDNMDLWISFAGMSPEGASS